MRVILRSAVAAVLFVTAVLAHGQQPVTVASSNSVTLLQGRIVLYDWVLHETTQADDFVIRTDQGRLVRIIYKPFWGWDAPPAESKDVLDRWAFVGKGSMWSFSAQSPRTELEKNACSATISNHKYQDESGSGEIPRFVATPGAETAGVPSVQSLPCYILKRGGMSRTAGDSGAATRNPQGAANSHP